MSYTAATQSGGSGDALTSLEGAHVYVIHVYHMNGNTLICVCVSILYLVSSDST